MLAGRLIEEAHELKDTPIGQAFPALGLCSSGKKVPEDPLLADHGEDSDEEAHKGMSKKDLEIHHIKKKKAKLVIPGAEPDPLNQYGFGMMAYKDLMFTLAALFSVLSLIMLPAMIYYNSQEGMPVTASFS